MSLPSASPPPAFSAQFGPYPFTVTPKLEGDRVTIVIVGELDMATVPLLEEAQRSVQGRYRTLRYDLSGLSFMDSASLSALLAPADSDIPISGISISHAAPIVRRLLEIRGLQSLISDTGLKALASQVPVLRAR